MARLRQKNALNICQTCGLWPSRAVEATATCTPPSTGTPVTVNLPAGAYYGLTTEAATQTAQAAALAQAESELVCIGPANVLAIPYAPGGQQPINDPEIFPSLSDAEDAFARAGSCSIYRDRFAGMTGFGVEDFVSFSALLEDGEFTVNAVTDQSTPPIPTNAGGVVVIKFDHLTASEQIGYSLTVSGDTFPGIDAVRIVLAILYNEAGTEIDSDIASMGSASSSPVNASGTFTIPSSGVYVLYVVLNTLNTNGITIGDTTYQAEFTFPEGSETCPMQASYEDGEDTETVICS